MSQPLTPAPEPNADKRRFALELMRTPSDPYNAVRRTFPAGSAIEAVFITAQWPNDPEVLQYIAELSQVTAKAVQLPTKEDVARIVYDLSTDREAKLDFKERLAGLRLFADFMGYIEKPNTNPNVVVNNNIGNKVMVVQNHGTDDEWEARCAAQQSDLISAARANT